MFTENDFQVTLMNKNEVKDFIRKHGEFACVCYNTPIVQAEQVGLHCLQSGHLSGSRHLYFVFNIGNIPRFTVDQLVRHEVGVVKNVQSLRYVTKGNLEDIDAGFNIYIPPELRDNIEDRWEFQRTEDYLNLTYRRLIKYQRHIVNKERANEIARTFIPIGVATSCSFACNLEGLINLAHKRLCNRAELPIHKLVQMMVKEVVAVEPRYKEFLVPQCKYLGYCPEGKGCGMYEPKKIEK